ncbi:hypothetical protein BC940DRAFT_314638 [Gongronella butleri]|nr:hypothetical protein BC940DRAFT_314638 [Gongronella butleri]
MQAGPSIRDTKLVLQEVPSTVTTRQTISVMPINTTPLPRVERYTLQEVQQSPTYYTSASVSKHNSVDSNFSSGSTSSSRAMSPPGSPQKRPATSDHAHRSELQHEEEENEQNEQNELKEEETPKYPSWTASYHHTTPKEPHPPLMVGSDMPLGWLRPSLNPTAVLDPVLRPEAPLHFVFAGFGNTQVWHSLFGVQVTMPMTGAMAERTVHWPVDSHQAICTLVTPDMDHPKTLDEWKNLVLCRLGITTIMLCLDIHTSV